MDGALRALTGCNPVRVLPHRPVLRDEALIRWRTDSAIVIGSAPDQVTVDGIDETWVAWVRRLDGTRTLDEVLLSAPERDAALHLLRALTSAHCLDDAALMPRIMRRQSVALRDAVTRRRPGALALYGSPAHALVALDRRAAVPVHVVGSEPLAERLVASLRTAGLKAVAGEPEDPRALVVQCASDDPDAAYERPWSSTCVHLSVATVGRRIVLGPLVVPGRTPCLRCAFWHRVDRDPQWPRIASQIMHLPATPPDDTLVALGFAWAVAYARSAIDLGLPTMRITDPLPRIAVLGQRIELTLPAGEVHAHRIGFHPYCGCTWAAVPPLAS